MNSTDRTSEIVETGKLKDKTTKKRKREAMKDKIPRLDKLIPQQIIARRRLL